MLRADILFLKLGTIVLPELRHRVVGLWPAEIVELFKLLYNLCCSTVKSSKSSKNGNWKVNVLSKSSKCQFSKLGKSCSL